MTPWGSQSLIRLIKISLGKKVVIAIWKDSRVFGEQRGVFNFSEKMFWGKFHRGGDAWDGSGRLAGSLTGKWARDGKNCTWKPNSFLQLRFGSGVVRISSVSNFSWKGQLPRERLDAAVVRAQPAWGWVLTVGKFLLLTWTGLLYLKSGDNSNNYLRVVKTELS